MCWHLTGHCDIWHYAVCAETAAIIPLFIDPIRKAFMSRSDWECALWPWNVWKKPLPGVSIKPVINMCTVRSESRCALIKSCWKWCPRASVQTWTRLILFANTFCRPAFGKSMCTHKRCWKWCQRQLRYWQPNLRNCSISVQRLSESTDYFPGKKRCRGL
jgi:hypothetical protein